ncbi:MAG: hypothetical protein M1828_002996 [Chrysothrix sp. TS-e1954]|nr:MAG: hypothetical protein M1828_002996 [Chrysothrix sp. TS-e1954]
MGGESAIAGHNRAYFDDLAARYDVEPWQQEMSSRVSNEIQNKLDFIGVDWAREGEQRSVRLLDYACGTGMISRALGPFVTQTRGIDISSKMVERYNEMARRSNLSADTAHAVNGDLFRRGEPDEVIMNRDFCNFDIAAIGFGFHHFEDTGLAVRRLAERLKPGGVVLILDFADSNRLPSAADRSITKHGFTEVEMKKIFEDEGLEAVGYSLMEGTVELRMHEPPVLKKVFLGRAQKKQERANMC